MDQRRPIPLGKKGGLECRAESWSESLWRVKSAQE